MEFSLCQNFEFFYSKVNDELFQRVKLTEYGYCITNMVVTNMTTRDQHDHIHGTNKMNVLDLTLAFNVSDWTSGYFGDIGGFIAYFSAPGQDEELRYGLCYYYSPRSK